MLVRCIVTETGEVNGRMEKDKEEKKKRRREKRKAESKTREADSCGLSPIASYR